jgi:hypothetical protein
MGLAGLAHFALKDGDVAKALELTKKALEFTEPAEAKAATPARSHEKSKSGIVDEAAPTEKRSMRADVKLSEAKPEEAKPEEKAPEAPAAPTPQSQVADPAAAVAAAEKALAAGDAKGAAVELEKAVSALLGAPAGPKMRKEGLIEKIQKQ